MQACSEDVAELCGHVVPGDGRVNACLRANEAKLTADCKTQVHEAEAREHQELSLIPVIRKCVAACGCCLLLNCQPVD